MAAAQQQHPRVCPDKTLALTWRLPSSQPLHPQRGACCHGAAVDFPSALTLFLTKMPRVLDGLDMSRVNSINIRSLDLDGSTYLLCNMVPVSRENFRK